MTDPVVSITPGSFSTEAHYYPRVPNARLHSMVRSFLRMGNDRIATRYCHLHPEVDPVAVVEVLANQPRYFRWAGADLFHVTNERGVRFNVLIETNSSPSGQKSMPLIDDDDDQGGYRRLLSRTFLPMLDRRRLPTGDLAVLWDKNEMETGGYAAALADLTGETVHLVHWPEAGDSSHAGFDDGVLQVHTEAGTVPIRAAFRYVTQRPWSRIPPLVKTTLLNPVIACLAGGRNKLLAAKAYDMFNAEMSHTGLQIRTPDTIWDVSLREVPLWLERMGGVAVVKNPYSNAGQGVWTLTNPGELERFMRFDHPYDTFIVQGLVGNLGWTSRTRSGRLYHVGTVPGRDRSIFVADLRFMVGVDDNGFFPNALYARRACEPLAEELTEDTDSWSMLGTNLSIKRADGTFDTDPSRLMLMDERDFNRLGVGVDDLTEAYLQTAMATVAIDRMAQRLVNSKGLFRRRLFSSLDHDPRLLDEICA
jgi:hypothetical protein